MILFIGILIFILEGCILIFGKHINRYYIRYLPLLLLGILSLVMVDYFQLKIPEMYKLVINGMNTGQVEIDGQLVAFDLDVLLDRICMPMIIIILAMVVGRFLWRICFFGSAIRLETDVRGRMFDHCKDLSHQYYQVNKVGNLMSLFTNDLETVQDCFGSGILMFFDAAILGILAIYKMWHMDGILTVLSFIPMIFLFIMASIVSNKMERKWERRQECYSQLSDFSQESFSGIAVIKAFVKEAVELMAFKKLNRENEEANVSFTKTAVLMRVMVMFFVESVICIILGYGGWLVYQGKFNAGQLMEFIGYFNSIIWPVMALSDLIDMTSRGKASLKRVGALLEAKRDMQDPVDAQELKNIRGDIEFKNLTFRYPDGEFDVLENITFTIPADTFAGYLLVICN